LVEAVDVLRVAKVAPADGLGRRVLFVRDRHQMEGVVQLAVAHDLQAVSHFACNPPDLIGQLREKIGRFEAKVLEHAQVKPAYECLLTMPGVGTILALSIMLETGDIGRFATVGDYTSYCHCVRATHTSNGKKKAHNNGKNGNPYLAWAFVEAVHHALRTCPQAKSFYEKKRAKRNGALATKALAAKWSKVAYYIMKRQEAFDLTRVFG